jgi:hypothetical protein
MTHAIPPGFERCPACGELTDKVHDQCITPETAPPAKPTRPALRMPPNGTLVSDGGGVSFAVDLPRRKKSN